MWRVLSRCHDLRNKAEYGGDMMVDERIVMDLIEASSTVLKAIENLLEA